MESIKIICKVRLFKEAENITTMHEKIKRSKTVCNKPNLAKFLIKQFYPLKRLHKGSKIWGYLN